MNKTRFLTLVILLCFVLSGIGYAYWNDTLSITSTVTTGDLNVEFIPICPLSPIEYPYIEYNGRTDYEDSRLYLTIVDDNHTLAAGFKDVFPGMYFYVPFIMKNTGTIPAVFRNCTVTRSFDASTLGNQSEEGLLDQLDRYLIISNLQMKVYNKNNAAIKTINIVNGPLPQVITLGLLEEQINNSLANNPIRLEPGQYVQLTSNDGSLSGGHIRFKFSEGFDNTIQGKTFTVNIHMDWKQFNE